MKRSELKRKRRLESDPVKLRDWQRRSRERVQERAAERAALGLAPRRKTKVRVRPNVRREAFRRSRGLCVGCLHRADVDLERVSIAALGHLVRRGLIREAVQFHHVLPEREWPALAQEDRNGVGMCPDCHYQHEQPGVNDGRLALVALPPAVRAFVLTVAEQDGQAAAYIERTYR